MHVRSVLAFRRLIFEMPRENAAAAMLMRPMSALWTPLILWFRAFNCSSNLFPTRTVTRTLSASMIKAMNTISGFMVMSKAGWKYQKARNTTTSMANAAASWSFRSGNPKKSRSQKYANGSIRKR